MAMTNRLRMPNGGHGVHSCGGHGGRYILAQGQTSSDGCRESAACAVGAGRGDALTDKRREARCRGIPETVDHLFPREVPLLGVGIRKKGDETG